MDLSEQTVDGQNRLRTNWWKYVAVFVGSQPVQDLFNPSLQQSRKLTGGVWKTTFLLAEPGHFHEKHEAGAASINRSNTQGFHQAP